jgi:hypothetical protein
MTNQARNPNGETHATPGAADLPFALRHSFVIRHPSFDIP